jgi:hypothetical protein
MKGFIKILEAIVASVIILTSLTFFFNTQLKETNWGDVYLKIRADDALATLVKSGTVQQAVKNDDATALNSVMLNANLSMMPITVDYSIQIKGIPNPVIFVGCNCTQAEIDTLKSYLQPLDFKYKDRSISMRIEFDNINNIRNETNVLVVFGYKNLNPFSQKLSKFLERDGTIMMIGDLTNETEDGYMNTTFGLKWVGGTRSNTGTFFDPDNENITSFRIAKYYSNLTGAAASFTFAGAAAIGMDKRTVVTDGTYSLVKVNGEIVNGHGRAVWMADPNKDKQTSNMTKAVMMWASGESFKMDTTSKTPAQKNFKSSAVVFGSDPYEIILTVWKVFQ